MFFTLVEFNVFIDSTASYEVFANWPTPVLYSGVEIGVKIKTGRKVGNGNTAQNPVAWAYDYNLANYAGKPEPARSSWDQTAVLCAVRDPEDYFYINGPGRLVVDQSGDNRWEHQSDGNQYFLVHKYPYQDIADIIDDLMLDSEKF